MSRMCLRERWMENCGSAPTIPRMYTRICRKIQRLRFQCQVLPTHGFVCMEQQYLRTIWRQKKCCIANPIVKGQYQTADNPIFEVFYLDNAHGVIADFSGNPPYEF